MISVYKAGLRVRNVNRKLSGDDLSRTSLDPLTPAKTLLQTARQLRSGSRPGLATSGTKAFGLLMGEETPMRKQEVTRPSVGSTVFAERQAMSYIEEVTSDMVRRELVGKDTPQAALAVPPPTPPPPPTSGDADSPPILLPPNVRQVDEYGRVRDRTNSQRSAIAMETEGRLSE